MLFFENPLEAQKRKKRQREEWRRFCAETEKTPWSEDFRVPKDRSVVIAADTWQPFRLFDVETAPQTSEPSDEHGVLSPNRLWIYDEAMFPGATAVPLVTGSVRANWFFDAPAPIPRVCEYTESHQWRLWMSYTPTEVATQRPGVRFARGHVVVAGLGMGWMLTRVLQKKTVRRVTLIEQNQALCDWILPQLRARHLVEVLNHKTLDVVVGDANDIVPTLEADVALWDIWPGLGDVDADDEQRMARKCPGIGRTWFWGAHLKREPESRSWYW